MGCGSSSGTETSNTHPSTPTTKKQEYDHANSGSNLNTGPEVNRMTPEYITSVFAEFDENGDGYITIDELKRAFIKMEIDCDDDKLGKFMRNLDVDGDNRINIDEFAKFWMKEQSRPPPPTMDELIHCFHQVDTEGNGSVTTDQLRTMLVQTKGYYTDEEVTAIMINAELEDDRVSFPEFIRLMTKMFSATTSA